jgi:predicted ferric reductase
MLDARYLLHKQFFSFLYCIFLLAHNFSVITDIFGIRRNSRYASFKLSAIKKKTKKTAKNWSYLVLESAFIRH